MGNISYLFEFGYIILGGWGKLPLPLDIFESNIPYIIFFYFTLLPYVIIYMQCIILKGNTLNKKQCVNVRRVSS